MKSSGISFAYAKAAEGLPSEGIVDPDTDFAINEANAKSAGVLIGAYYFAHPDLDKGTTGADTEASYFWGIAGSYINTNGYSYLMPMLDWEQDVSTTTPAYTQTTFSQWVNEWCEDIVNDAKANGVVVTPVVYTYVSYSAGTSGYAPGLNSTVTQWPLWMASPDGQNIQTGGPSQTTPWSTWALWQYGQGTVSGITTGAVDEDVFDGTLSQLTNMLVIGKAVAPPPSGVTNYWDPGLAKASPGSGGSGTWDNSTSNWWHGGSSDITWSTAGDYAIFAGTSGTVTLGTGVAADAITFNNGNYTIAGTSTLTMNSPGNIILPTGTTNSITCVFGGGGYTLSGGGTLYLNNAGNFCAGETVVGPNTMLQVATDHDAGNDGVTMNLQNGGIYEDLDSTTGDQFILPGCAVALLSGGGIFENPNANLSMTNWITGSGSLTYIGGSRTLTLTDATNNYSGGTIVQSGTLKANATGTLGATSGSIAVYGGTLDLGGASHTVGTVMITNGTIQDGTLTGTSYTGQGGTISAVLAGSAGFAKSTAGTLTLSGSNTFAGNTTISSGLLQVSSDANFGTAPSSFVPNSITISSGTNANYGIRVQSASFTLNANRGITLNGGGQIQIAQGYALTYNGVIGGNGGFMAGTSTTVGYGTLVLGGSNTYSGPTLIAAGTLQLGSNNALPYGTPLTIAAAISVGGVFNMNGNSQTIGPLASSPGIGGTGTNIPTVNLTGALTMLETNDSSFNGVINGSGGSLTVNGNNTLTLNGSNTYSGSTTVKSGTLALGATGSISKSASISIGAGGTFDVSAIANYSFGTITSLTASGTGTPAVINGESGGTVNLGNQPITLNYDGSHPALTITQGTLVMNNNSITINGSRLAPGTYTLIHQAAGNITASGNFAVQGPFGGDTVGTISINGGDVDLIIQPVAKFTNLILSTTITYGRPTVTLRGTVVGDGPTYPAMGERVTVTISTNTQTTTISDPAGDFSFSFSSGWIACSHVPYAVTYSYAGDAALVGGSDSSTIITVNPLPIVLTGARSYNGTSTAAAAILSVANKMNNDAVNVASGSSTLMSGNVGTQAIASFGNLALGGVAATNYTLTGASGSVTVTAPPFSISSAALDITGSNFIISWQSAPGATYQLLGSPDLISWTNVGAPIVATSTVTLATNAINSSANFFNVTGH